MKQAETRLPALLIMGSWVRVPPRSPTNQALRAIWGPVFAADLSLGGNMGTTVPFKAPISSRAGTDFFRDASLKNGSREKCLAATTKRLWKLSILDHPLQAGPQPVPEADDFGYPQQRCNLRKGFRLQTARL